MERKQLNWVLVTWVVAALLIVAAFVIAYLHSKATEAELATQFNHEQLILARVTANGISSLFDDLEREVSATTRLEEMRRPLSTEAEREIRRLQLELSDVVDDVYVVNKSGNVLYSSRGSEASDGLSSELKRMSAVLAGGQPVAVSAIVDISGTEAKTALALPVKNAGSFSGSIVAVVSVNRVSTLYLHDITSTQDSYAWVIDDQGILISNPRHPKMIFNNVFSLKEECGVCHMNMKLERRMAAGLSGMGELDVMKSTRKLVAYYPARIGQKTWTIAIAAPYSEVTKLARKSFGYTVGLLTLIVGALLGGATLVSRAGSEIIRAEERTKWTEYALQSERLATIGRMSAKVAHEIRNPLTSIALNTDLLGDELESYENVDSAEARSLIRSIGNEVERLRKVMDEYLQFARLPKLRGESVNVSAILSQLISFLKGELDVNKIKLSVNLNRFVPPVAGDGNQLRQAFMNIVRNAVEAMPKGGELRISTRAVEGQVEVEISDTGIGIKEEHNEKIFHPFFSTKEQGTGLGLSVAREIVTEHGGEISLKSAPGQGTVCLITLPVERAS